MGKQPLPRFFRPGQYAVAHGESPLAAAFHHAQARLGHAFGFPAFRHGDRLAALDIDNAQYRNLGHAAQFVESTAGADVDQAFVGHIAQQRLELDLFLPLEAEGLGNFTLARGRRAGGDEVHDPLSGRETGGLGRAGLAGGCHSRDIGTSRSYDQWAQKMRDNSTRPH